MMTRIVKMTFQSERIPDFLKIFEEAKPKIEAMAGCHGVELVRVIDQPEVLMTISEWDGPDALEGYRNSELFKSTWAKTKIHFSDRPEAWSVAKIK